MPGKAASGINSNTIVVGDLGQGTNGASTWEVVYFAWRNSGAPSCYAQGDGSLGYNANGATVSVGNPTITVPDENRRYTLKACASNGFGVVESGTTTQRAITQIGPPTGNAQYTVGTTANGGGNSYHYDLASGPTMSASTLPCASVTTVPSGTGRTRSAPWAPLRWPPAPWPPLAADRFGLWW